MSDKYDSETIADVIPLGKKRHVELPTPEPDFETTMRKNAEIKKRMEEDRKKANKGVIRSYRLKH